MMTVPEQATTPLESNPPHNTAHNPPKLAIAVSIVLCVVFIAAVLLGARIIMDRNTYTPVGVSPVLAPYAESAACTSFTESMPDKMDDYTKVEIVDPAPAGVTAYRNSEGTALTVRCGVNVPAEYTVLSTSHDEGGLEWFSVKDDTPGSNLSTHYQVTGTPVIAVTSEAPIGSALADISAAGGSSIDDREAPQPQAFPLSTTRLENDGHPRSCKALLDALPDSMGEFTAKDVSQLEGAPSQSKVWVADDREPIVLRCGVEVPESFEPGAMLDQVNDVPWYSEPDPAKGPTSGRYYALGREAIVALYMPGTDGNDIVTTITKAIEDNLDEEKMPEQ